MVRVYMSLSLSDRSYGTTMFGLMKMGDDNLKDKLREDVSSMATYLPRRLKLEEELAPITRAIADTYEEFFPFEGGLSLEG